MEWEAGCAQGDSKSLLVHICSDLGRRDKGRGLPGCGCLVGVGVGRKRRRGQGWRACRDGCTRCFWFRDEHGI